MNTGGIQPTQGSARQESIDVLAVWALILALAPWWLARLAVLHRDRRTWSCHL